MMAKVNEEHALRVIVSAATYPVDDEGKWVWRT